MREAKYNENKVLMMMLLIEIDLPQEITADVLNRILDQEIARPGSRLVDQMFLYLQDENISLSVGDKEKIRELLISAYVGLVVKDLGEEEV